MAGVDITAVPFIETEGLLFPAMFTRASTAYKQDGTQILSNFPRYETGYSGQAIMVEEGTTNLCTYPSDFSNAVWIKRGTWSMTPGQADPFGGNNATLVTGIDVSPTGDMYRQDWTVASGTRFEPAIYIKRVSTSGVIQISHPVAGTYGYWTVNLASLNDSWNRITRSHPAVTITTEFIGSPANIGGILINKNSGTGTLSAYLFATQVEVKSYSTSWQNPTDGARVVETNNAHALGILTQAGPWAISLRYKCPQTVVVSGLTRTLFEWRADANNLYGIYLEGSTGKIRTIAKSGGTPVQNTASALIVKDTWYHIVLVNDGTKIYQYHNGAATDAGVSFTAPVGNMAANFYIGNDGAGANQCNGLIDDFRIFSRALTDSEVAALYAGTQPSSVDAAMTGRLSFDSTLDFDTIISAQPFTETESLLAGFPATIGHVIFTEQELLGATIAPYVYVVDSGNNRVNAYDYDGNFKFSFGSYGTGNGQFNDPYDVNTNGTYVYVTDSGNNRVQVFTMFGVYVGKFGSFGSAEGQFSNPMGIAVDDRYIWVVDNGNNRFQVFDLWTYAFVYALGEYGSGENQFNGPTDCSVDALYFYITDAGNNRVVIYPKTFYFGADGAGTFAALTGTATGACRSGSGIAKLPPLTIISSAIGLAGAVGNGASRLPALSSTADGTITKVSGIGAGQFAPLSGSAQGLAGSVGSCAGVLAPITASISTGYEKASGDGAGILAPLTGVSFGTASLASVTYSGITVNLKNKAITEYTNYSFNSFAKIGDKYYGANETGIHLLEGADDAGTKISALFKTGIVDLHRNVVHRLHEAYLEWRASGNAKISVDEKEGDVTEYTISDPDPKIHDTRQEFAKGHKEREVAFTFENIDGSDFDVLGLRVKARQIPMRIR